MDIKTKIRTVPDYPKKGIMFRDISTLLSDSKGLSESIEKLSKRYLDKKNKIDYIAGVESRGFIIGSALALKLNKGFIMIRKPGKLPGNVISQEYELEYGKDRIEIQANAFSSGSKILLVDDLIATGGTIMAAIKLIEALGGEIFETAFIINLPDLGGSKEILQSGYSSYSLVEFEGG